MGHKTSPIAFRIPTLHTWRSRWFDRKHYPEMLEEDQAVRTLVTTALKNAAVERVEIERSARQVTIAIWTSRPGMVIGRGGEEIERLQSRITRLIHMLRQGTPASRGPRQRKTQGREMPRIKLEVQEVRSPESSAALVAQRMVQEIEKRMPFRRILRQTVERVRQEKNVRGVKIQVSGRLDGAEMSRVQWLGRGELPLANLRADIDFAKLTAYCSYGTVGVKVWIYKGEKFG